MLRHLKLILRYTTFSTNAAVLTSYLQENSIKGRLDKGEFAYQKFLDISVKIKTADFAETLVREILTACNPIMEIFSTSKRKICWSSIRIFP